MERASYLGTRRMRMYSCTSQFVLERRQCVQTYPNEPNRTNQLQEAFRRAEARKSRSYCTSHKLSATQPYHHLESHQQASQMMNFAILRPFRKTELLVAESRVWPL